MLRCDQDLGLIDALTKASGTRAPYRFESNKC